MKAFKDLQFVPHPTGLSIVQARMDFPNDYGVSVIQGGGAYSGNDSYEVAVMKGGNISYSTGITDDVLSYQTESEVSEIMKKVQQLKDVIPQ